MSPEQLVTKQTGNTIQSALSYTLCLVQQMEDEARHEELRVSGMWPLPLSLFAEAIVSVWITLQPDDPRLSLALSMVMA